MWQALAEAEAGGRHLLGALSSFITAPVWTSLKDLGSSWVYVAISCRISASFASGAGRGKCSLCTGGDHSNEANSGGNITNRRGGQLMMER